MTHADARRRLQEIIERRKQAETDTTMGDLLTDVPLVILPPFSSDDFYAACPLGSILQSQTGSATAQTQSNQDIGGEAEDNCSD